MTRISIGLIFILLSSLAFSQVKITKQVSKVLKQVDTTAIRSRIIYLSDDKLLGRKPGTPGYKMAVDFVIDQFKSLGVAPKGDNGYLQNVVIRTARLDTTGSRIELSGVKLKLGMQAVLLPNMNFDMRTGGGSLVWLNYGITANHLNHDDYKGLDVKGKVVVVRAGTPSSFPASEKAHFNSPANKGDLAAKNGAVGIIYLEDKQQTLALAHDNAVKGIMGYVNKDGSVGSGRVSVHPGLRFAATLSSDLLKEKISSLGVGNTELNISITANVKSNYRDLESYNVIGWIEGTDPELKKEFVVHTAHLDHVGIGKPIRGDSIYNGAHDNASGTACLLEIARLYKQTKTRRSVLIALVTAEEMGLLGSRFLASNPPVPKDKLVADVNTDMPTLIAPLLSIEPLGAKHSTLMNEVNNAASHLSLEVQEDHMPDQVRFVRSDQYSFIREGIPALHVKYGLKTKSPTLDLKNLIDVWTEAHYHKPSDEFSDAAFNFSAAATYVRLNFLIGWQVANRTERPSWKEGDFFGQTFGLVR